MRKVQANKMEVPFRIFSKTNPHAVEDSVWSANNTDAVITFCCEASENAKVKSDLSAIEFLEKVKLTQNNWVYYGKVLEKCVQPWLSHNVSVTANIQNHEWDEVANYIYDNRNSFTAVSLLATTGDKDYPQAPFTAVYTADEIAAYYGVHSGECYKKAQELLDLVEEAYNGNLWVACDSVRIPKLVDCLSDEAARWLSMMHDFVREYFSGDTLKATYFLKDIYNWNVWQKLKESYRPVEYSEVVEDEDSTKIAESVACAGGACQLEF
jgi:ribonucleoside-triphosphate reductase (thioredoxin)